MEYPDEVLLDALMEKLYQELIPVDIENGVFLKYGVTITSAQFTRITRMVKILGLAEEIERRSSTYYHFRITDKGVELMLRHGGYNNYLKSVKQERKNEKLLRWITILVGGCTILTTSVGLLKGCS